MKSNRTNIITILDRSGSMSGRQDDVIGGYNNFVKEQVDSEGEIRFTLAQFDHEYEMVYDNIPIVEVPSLDFSPRGSTALLDAIGRTINTVIERYKKNIVKPDKTLFVIITDGYENSSSEFNNKQIKVLVEKVKEEYDFQFLFLGADIDGFAGGTGMSFKAANSVSVSSDYRSTFTTLSNNVKSYTADCACSTFTWDGSLND